MSKTVPFQTIQFSISTQFKCECGLINLWVHGLPKETVVAITILYRNTKVKVRSPDGDTEYFDIVAGVLQEDTLAPYLFIICLDYVLRILIDKIRENDFEQTKKRSRRYPAKAITNADYADDIALLANTPNQAETLLHSLERAAAGIGLHVNSHKTEYMCYNLLRTDFHWDCENRHVTRIIKKIYIKLRECPKVR